MRQEEKEEEGGIYIYGPLGGLLRVVRPLGCCGRVGLLGAQQSESVGGGR